MTKQFEYTRKIYLNKHNVETIDTVILSSKFEFNVELVYAYLMTKNIKSLYWNYSTQIYNRYYFGIQEDHVLPAFKRGEVVKCELCGTKKSIETPFEITNCRKLDQSIIEKL